MGAVFQLPMFPLSAVLFPHAELPLHVFEPRYRALVDHCLAADGEFGVVLIARGSEVGGGDQRFAVGTAAHIEAASRFDDGRWVLLATGRRRIAVWRWLADAPYPLAEVTALDDRTDGGEVDGDGVDDDRVDGGGDGGATAGFERARAAVRRVRTLMSELGSAAPVVADLGDRTDDDEEARVWRLCEMAPLTALDSQRLLEVDDAVGRLGLLSELCEALAGDLLLLLGGGPGLLGGGLGPDET